MVARQGHYHPAHRYRLGRTALRVSRRHDRKRPGLRRPDRGVDRKSTRLNSSHSQISYAVFCLKKKKNSSSTVCVSSLIMTTTFASATELSLCRRVSSLHFSLRYSASTHHQVCCSP